MKRFLSAILLIAFSQILLLGCKSTTTKMNSFVISYNKNVNRYTNSIITYSEAEPIFKEKTIKIKFLTSFNSDDTRNGLMQTLAPSTFSQLLLNDKLPRELINEGVTFEIEFLTKNAVVFSNTSVDQKKLIELEKDLSAKKASGNLQEQAERMDNPRMNTVLSMLNKNLPIKDKSTGLTMLKIDVNAANELIYAISVPDDVAKKITGKDGAEILKDDILRSGNSRKLMNYVKNLGINTIKYKYQDAKGRALNEVVLSEKDFK